MRFAALAVSLAVGFAAGYAAQRASLDEKEATRLFLIHRSTNRNVVAYDAVHGPGGFDPDAPIRAYWILREEGEREEELSGLERRRAYGVVLGDRSPREIAFHLVSLPDRPVTVRLGEDGPKATATIQGEEALLSEVFVAARDRSIIPGIRYVELRGVSPRTGARLRERIVP